jgi:hypothetical protein
MDELKPKVRPAKSIWGGPSPENDVFDETMAFLVAQSKLVERLYELDRDGMLSPGKGDVTEGRQFVGGQLVKGGQFLGDLWYSAWQSASIDKYLKGELARRGKASATEQ